MDHILIVKEIRQKDESIRQAEEAYAKSKVRKYGKMN